MTTAACLIYLVSNSTLGRPLHSIRAPKRFGGASWNGVAGLVNCHRDYVRSCHSVKRVVHTVSVVRVTLIAISSPHLDGHARQDDIATLPDITGTSATAL